MLRSPQVSVALTEDIFVLIMSTKADQNIDKESSLL